MPPSDSLPKPGRPPESAAPAAPAASAASFNSAGTLKSPDNFESLKARKDAELGVTESLRRVLAPEGALPRLLNLSDLDSCLTLERMCHPDPWSRANFKAELLRDISLPLGLFYDKSLIASSFAWYLRGEGHILNLSVHPLFRRQGLGEKLLRANLALAEALKSETLFLEVRETNLPALKLYRKLGFLAYSRRKGYYDNGEDALLMRRGDF
jgi:ribosomal-protein-alanine N-acetyltransferase